MADPIERIQLLIEQSRDARKDLSDLNNPHRPSPEDLPYQQLMATHRLVEMLGTIALAKLEDEPWEDTPAEDFENDEEED